MVKAVAVVYEGGGADLFFGAEALGVGSGEGAGLGLDANEGVVFVLGTDSRCRVVADGHGDVARAVGVVNDRGWSMHRWKNDLVSALIIWNQILFSDL